MFACHFSLGGKADCVALLLQMFDSSPSVSRRLWCISLFLFSLCIFIQLIISRTWCYPGSSIGVGEASFFCSSTWSGVVQREASAIQCVYTASICEGCERASRKKSTCEVSQIATWPGLDNVPWVSYSCMQDANQTSVCRMPILPLFTGWGSGNSCMHSEIWHVRQTNRGI